MPVHVELSKRLHYKPSPEMHRADSNDDDCACIIPANTTVTVQYARTGRVFLEAETAEQMRDYQLKDCAVSAVAVAADIPRILVQLQWLPAGSRAFTAIYTPAMSTARLLETDDNYDYRFDHRSEKLHDVLPILGPATMRCDCCGDETDAVPSEPSDDDFCNRCCPCWGRCEACRSIVINGISVCLLCVTAAEIPLIPERAQRRLSTFMSPT